MFQLIQRTKSHEATIAIIDSFVRIQDFAHIISLNPENLVEATKNTEFASAFNRADVVIADGAGILIAAKFLGIPSGDRITGIDLMNSLIQKYQDKTIVFVGGFRDAARRTMKHFASVHHRAKHSWTAFTEADKHDPTLIERVVAVKPDLLFVAFGSPSQELWIEKYRHQLRGTVCMGVGQSFDVYGGYVHRAPSWLRTLGLEWLFRLTAQPWRWRRQLRLLEFIFLMVRYRLTAK